ncbi:MAG: arginine decarboxylase, pyruvoyl-dependent [Thermoplasmata archaeon]|nr:MAG: arginine decarboxylase, pyruvoyl-dependent [Thermoplasmata archaeon]MCD6467833.1 arginine decarboxylase, pyruvoyl-dependent [Thermoplasmata archaeon]
MVPKTVFFTKGVGRHRDRLQSFELALRNAGIQMCNIVRVSSIIPPNCKVISREKGIAKLKPGEITYCVISQNETNEPNRLIGASIGVAIPKDRNTYGYISEHHSYGEVSKKAGDYAEDLAATMLATTLGLDFDIEKAWDERKQEFKMSGRIVKTSSVTQTAVGDKNGKWTTVIAAAVFVEE